MTRGRPLTMVLVLALLPSFAFSQHLDVEPAWNGLFRPGEATEVMVRFVADQAPGDTAPFELTLGVDGMAPDIRYRNTNVLPNSPLRVPVIAGEGGQLKLALTRQGELISETTSRLKGARSNVSLVAIAASLATLHGVEAEAIYVAPAALPVFPGSYRTIDLLVLDSAALAALTPEQSEALEHHVRACGRTVLHNVEPAVVAAFLALAGCRGRFIAATTSEPEVKAAAELMLSQKAPALPTIQQLQSLLVGADKGPLMSVAILLALYLVALGILAIRKHVKLLIWTPAFFAGVTLLAFAGPTRVTGEVASWAETESGSPSLLFKSLLRIPGSRSGEAQLDIDSLAEMPKPTRPGTTLLVAQQPNGVLTHTLNLNLLGTVDLVLTGSLPSPPMLEITLREGAVVITNPTQNNSSNATLAFNDQKYVVPGLGPGSEWQPTELAAVAWQQTPVERLFRERAHTGAALLVSTEGVGNGYIMVRP